MSTTPTQPITLTRVSAARQCQQCGADFWPLVNNTHQVVCSTRCRNLLNMYNKRLEAARMLEQERFCPHCKQRFSTSKAGKKYCGARCAADHRRQLERDERAAGQEKTTTTCAHCHMSFEYVVSGRPPRRYCSRECAGTAAMEAGRRRSAAARERARPDPESRPVVVRTAVKYVELPPVDDAGLEALLAKQRDALCVSGLTDYCDKDRPRRWARRK